MASKGVRCGSHPKYIAVARQMEDWLLDQIDSTKGKAFQNEVSSVPLGRRGVQFGKVSRDKVRLGAVAHVASRQGKDKGG